MLPVCVDDVRVWGRPLPLPPAANTTRWGHVTNWQGLEADCSDGDACINTTCVAPFTCFSTWRAATCRYSSIPGLVFTSSPLTLPCLLVLDRRCNSNLSHLLQLWIWTAAGGSQLPGRGRVPVGPLSARRDLLQPKARVPVCVWTGPCRGPLPVDRPLLNRPPPDSTPGHHCPHTLHHHPRSVSLSHWSSIAILFRLR